MESPTPQPKRRPPAYLFALGKAELPAELEAQGRKYIFSKLFKHDFFAATGLYQRTDIHEGESGEWAVLKVQRTYPYLGFPMKWLGRRIANHEILVYELLQGIRGIPLFLGRVGETGFLHEFIPGQELDPSLPLTPEFFSELETLFQAIHDRHIAYVDSNKRENILVGEDRRPWLIDFQISFCCQKGGKSRFYRRWAFRRFVRADWYHFYKHKVRLMPKICTREDRRKACNRGFLHRVHRFFARPMIYVRRRILSRYDLAKTR